MNPSAEETMFEDRLRTVYEKTESGDYDSAIANLAVARSCDPDNIYIVALERQLKSITALLDAQELGEARREELIEPMSGLIECALRELHRPDRTHAASLPQSQRLESGFMSPVFRTEEPDQPREPEETGRDDLEKKELEGLKLLYFQRASKFVTKGELERALAEVRRVFEVDPDNRIAKEYAARVETLIAEARHLSSAPAQAGKGTPASPNQTHVRPRGISQRVRPDAEPGAPSPEGRRNPQEGTSEQRTQSPESQRMPEGGTTPRSERTPQGGMLPHEGTSPRSQRTPQGGGMPERGMSPQSQRNPQAGASQQSGRSPQGAGSSQSARSPKSERGPAIANRAAPQASISHDVFSAQVTTKTGRMSPKIVISVIVLAVLLIAGGAYTVLFSGRTNMSPQQFKAVKPDPPDLIALNSQPGGKVEPAASLAPEQKPAQQNPGEASLTAKKPEPESPKVSPPPAAEQKTKPAAAAPDPVKSEPRQKAEQKPVQKPVPPPPAALHREAPPLSAKSAPESKADKAIVQAAEPAGTETPAFVPVQKEPEIVKLVQPEIPNLVWMYGAVEQVIVKVLIDADGKPIDTQILKSTKQVLEKPVIDAVLNSKFLPAQSATGPVRTWLTIPFKFKGPH